MGQKLWGVCPFGEEELDPQLTQCGQGSGLPACQVSSWSIQPFGHSAPTSQTDRQDRTDRQRSDSIGRTVLQTVAQKTKKTKKSGPMPNVMAALPTTGGALCSTPQFGWRLLLECRAVTLPRRETRWNLQGWPKLANKSQPLVGRSSPYYEDMWRRYCCLTSFFSDCRYMP